MARRMLAVCALALLVSHPALAQSVPAGASQPPTDLRLPVRRVVLYKNGIGYFEHLGTVRGSQTVTIELTGAQLDDALKSLTILDLADGRVAGVSYDSEAPLARRLGALRLLLGERAQLPDVLDALRGSPLEITSAGTTIAGRLLSVERRRTARDNREIDIDELVIVGLGGTIRRIELTPAVSVRIADADLAARVGEYLRLVASARDQDVRRLTIQTAGAGERPLLVSYVSEVPVWKTTYRIVLPVGATRKPLLQGWAIVDNTAGEDWEAVQLSLVAGAPQSFIQRLSQPYYVQRPVLPLPERVLLRPQTHQGVLVTAETPAPDAASPAARELRARAARERDVVGGVPGGVVGGVVGGLPEAAPPPLTERVRVDPAAYAREMGDLFEYALKQPVTIRQNQSALVPILQAEVAAEKVSIWNPSSGPRPLRAIWLTNESGLTLDEGSFTVIEGEAFAGEGLVDPLRPGERRLLSYAMDTAVLVDARQEPGPRRLERIRIQHGVMVLRREDRERRTYTIRNEDTSARMIVVEHPARSGWSLAGEAQPDERTPDYLRFRVPVEPKQTATLVVDETRPVETRYAIADLTDEQVMLLVREGTLSPAATRALQPILATKNQLVAVDRELAAQRSALEAVFQDQARVRENMKALKGSAEERALVKRYAQQLDEQEDRLRALRDETSTLERRRDDLQREVARLIEELAIEIEAS